MAIVVVIVAISVITVFLTKNKKKENKKISIKIEENEENQENQENQENENNEETDKTEENEENEENDLDNLISYKINENNFIKTTMNDNFAIPTDGKLQVVGADFQHKNSTFIIDINNKTFTVDDNGTIKGVTKENFPLYYSFNGTITNGSYLFKDVKCFKAIDLSKMDSSKMIDVSNMFENSEFEEINFGTENESYSGGWRII